MKKVTRAQSVLELLDTRKPKKEQFDRDFVAEIEARRQRLIELLQTLRRTSRPR